MPAEKAHGHAYSAPDETKDHVPKSSSIFHGQGQRQRGTSKAANTVGIACKHVTVVTGSHGVKR